jgi:integrase
MKLAAAIEEFIQYKRSLGNPYIGPANTLKAFLRKTGNLELHALTTQHGEAFLPVNGRTVTSNWFHRYQVLGSFFRFAASRGYMQQRVLPAALPDRPPHFVPYIYSTEDVRRLLAVPDSHYPPDCPLSPDTIRTLLLLLYGTGLRLGEATRLKHEDADFKNAALTIRETKFGKSRLVPIGRIL